VAKAGKVEHTNNDYIQLSRVSESNQASHLLKLLITTSSVCDLKGLFTVVLHELKDIVDFAAGDLIVFDKEFPTKHTRLTYIHGRVTEHSEEELTAPPGVSERLPIASFFDFPTPMQIHRSHWVKALPAESLLFRKETEYEYTYYIPFVQDHCIQGILQFRTNRKGGFSPRDGAVIHIGEKILTPKFLDLIKKASPVSGKLSSDEPAYSHDDLIGKSNSIKKVFSLVSQVAPTQSSVLILGETGTGKELIARALHNASSRRNKPMVKVNCAALPPNIMESELFGHERGSFTGAIERRIGKFELANNSTLFLDEVGELPPDLQVKLLRAVQEKEIERIGGNAVIKVNVRIVAATNRNLLKEVQLGNFRNDLYFRLNVFPITLPPLRERKEDIPLLAMHFLTKHTKTGIKRVAGFSSKVMKQLKAFDWPGNVRELEHLVERCVLLANGDLIRELPVVLSCMDEISDSIPEMRVKTIDQVEREHIVNVLEKCNGKVAGVGGAAEALKIPSSTLNSKMRRLNIKRAYMDHSRSS
jgi:transcriptional regulator with GAF, ATPase, and Fis domain